MDFSSPHLRQVPRKVPVCFRPYRTLGGHCQWVGGEGRRILSMAGGSVDTQAIRRSSRKASSRKNRSNDGGEVSRLQATNTQKYPRTGKRGAPQVFPRKLYEILMNEPSEIVSWTDAGDAFLIKDMEVCRFFVISFVLFFVAPNT